MRQDGHVPYVPVVHSADTPELRKARGAFFTPDEVTTFIARWAITSPSDQVLEPSAGNAAFLVAAVRRLRELSGALDTAPRVDGVEIHRYSAQVGTERVREAGGEAEIRVSDFFLVDPAPRYDAIIGNPPYVRYQEWTGQSRSRSREAALRAGVSLTGLASSWAAFTVHSSLFLKRGGRLGLVLPAELLSVNYAAPVRKFLFDHFSSVELVLFDEQVFPEAETDVVLLLADGYQEGPTDHAVVRQARGARDLVTLGAGEAWTPVDPAGKWTGSLVGEAAVAPLNQLLDSAIFAPLEHWGDTTLGIVTGANNYFTLSPARVRELGLRRNEILRLSPPGSTHLRGLQLSATMLARLGAEGKATYLFHPGDEPSPQALRYIEMGHATGVDKAYKCRVRKVWYQVPLVRPADLLLTCMNADTPRLTTNQARAYHLNSVHGVYLAQEYRELGSELLPLASLNSLTLLNAEMVGRAYGGGILKIEPKEADVWGMPSPRLVADRAVALRKVRHQVAHKLRTGQLLDAVAIVDDALLLAPGLVSSSQISRVRDSRAEMARRRMARSIRGK
jgi:tRNA1(Val) A37 N6-methylase TrmN6